MKNLLKIISILLIGLVASVGALTIGYQFGKANKIYGNSISPSVENYRTQALLNQQLDEIPDEALGLYSINCASCHGATGEGSAIAPPLDNSDLRTRLEDSEIITTIADGRPGTAMPAWRDRLTDAQINALTSLIRNWGSLDAEQLSELDSQKSYGHGMGNCRGSNSMMGAGCGSGMGGHMWPSP